MKDKMISIRLSLSDYNKLKEISKPAGGVSKWISLMLVYTNEPKQAPVKTVKSLTDRIVHCFLKP